MSGTNTFTPRKDAWDVTFGGFNFGTMNKVDPSKLKMILEPIWRGTTGGPKVVLGHFIVGMEGQVDAEVMDVTLAAFQAAAPWWSTGSIPLLPETFNTDLSTGMMQHMEPWLEFRMDWSWRASLPGAAIATLLWFVTTLLFGFYVTRFANYSQVYGSLGAAIALLFWLYIIALSVLIGSEFNAQLIADLRNAQKMQPFAQEERIESSDR